MSAVEEIHSTRKWRQTNVDTADRLRQLSTPIEADLQLLARKQPHLSVPPLFFSFRVHYIRRNSSDIVIEHTNVSRIAPRSRLILASSFHEFLVKSYGVSTGSTNAFGWFRVGARLWGLYSCLLASIPESTMAGCNLADTLVVAELIRVEIQNKMGSAGGIIIGVNWVCL